MNNKIIKTKKRIPKTFTRVWGAQEIAEKMWGQLKVADSFLFLYRSFGSPCADTNDEYKISYEYTFRYRGFYFVLCSTTPDFVYMDCFVPQKYFRIERNRYREDVRKIFDRAANDGILTYPWASNTDVMKSLTKQQQKQAMKMFLEEMIIFLGEENSKFMEGITQECPEEDKKRCLELHKKLWEYLADKFWKWAENDDTAKALFRNEPDLHYLPEVEKIIKQFCKQMLKTKPIRDCDINIQGCQ